jgi:hypothetical protein
VKVEARDGAPGIATSFTNVHYSYPLVNIQKTDGKITMLLMGKSTISTGPFSIAMLLVVSQRVFFV